MNARLKPRNTLLPASVPSNARLLALEDCLRPAPVARAMRAVLISSSTSVAPVSVAKRFAGTPSAFAVADACQRYFLHVTARRRLVAHRRHHCSETIRWAAVPAPRKATAMMIARPLMLGSRNAYAALQTRAPERTAASSPDSTAVATSPPGTGRCSRRLCQRLPPAAATS